MTPKVSILIASYNLESYIERCIRSALTQTYKNTEIIVVDDHSTDNTWKKLQHFSSKVKLFRHDKQQRIGAVLNTGLSNASGDYLVRLDADDQFYPTLIETTARFLENHSQIDYVSTDYDFVNEDGRKIEMPKIPYFSPENIYHVDFTAVGTLMRRKCIEKSGWSFDPDMHLQEMYEFYLRILSRHRGAFINKKLWAYTRRPGQATSKEQRLRFLKYTVLAIEKNYGKEFKKITE